ncbi:MAG: SPFH domain-containing protein [Candidatus Micrarchaeota archaeon]
MSFFYVLLAAIVLSILSRTILVLDQYERAVRYRLGKFLDVLGPGVTIIWPGLDAVEVVDMRVKTLDIPEQKVITKDNAVIMIDAFLYYVPVRPDLLILKVKDFEYAIVQLAQTTLRSIVGEHTFDQAISNREQVNLEIMDKLDDVVERWGAKLIAIEIRELLPASRKLTFAMNVQVAGERKRRAAVLEAEGFKTAAILNAEGDRDQACIEAEGTRQAMIILANGEAEALKRVAVQASESITGPAMTLWQLGMVEELGKNKDSTLLMPYNIKSLTKAFRGIEGKRGD